MLLRFPSDSGHFQINDYDQVIMEGRRRHVQSECKIVMPNGVTTYLADLLGVSHSSSKVCCRRRFFHFEKFYLLFEISWIGVPNMFGRHFRRLTFAHKTKLLRWSTRRSVIKFKYNAVWKIWYEMLNDTFYSYTEFLIGSVKTW